MTEIKTVQLESAPTLKCAEALIGQQVEVSLTHGTVTRGTLESVISDPKSGYVIILTGRCSAMNALHSAGISSIKPASDLHGAAFSRTPLDKDKNAA